MSPVPAPGDAPSSPTVDVVIPTIGRPSLRGLLDDLVRAEVCAGAVIVVDDRPRRPDVHAAAAWSAAPAYEPFRLIAATSGGRGPAAARNVGWSCTEADWVVFLDDDVRLTESWWQDLRADLDAAGPDVAAVQAGITVPRPAGASTEGALMVLGLQDAPWITADLAVRREALRCVGGFDERFRTAYREDTDLAIRLRRDGWRLQSGRRRAVHPVPDRTGPWWDSIRRQRGNADDARLLRMHGRRWRRDGDARRGDRTFHMLGTAAAVAAVLGRRRRLAMTAWLALTARSVVRRLPHPPSVEHPVATTLVTNILIPPAATWWWFIGLVSRPSTRRRRPELALFDRDGTLIEDVPGNADPALVRPMPGAADAVALLRSAGCGVGVVSNQAAVGRGHLTRHDVEAINGACERAVGPLDVWRWCEHLPEDGCDCRKPRSGMVLDASRTLGVRADATVVVGDIESDILAAERVGAVGILVPNAQTASEELARCPIVMPSITAAARLVRTWRREPRPGHPWGSDVAFATTSSHAEIDLGVLHGVST